MQPGQPGPAETRTCPDCGRSVPAAKLCPHCGYPLLLDADVDAAQVQPEYLRKPVPQRPADPEPHNGPQVVSTPAELRGPHCPACRHRSAARRVRCEHCATELWPGAATPVRPAVTVSPPPVRAARPVGAWVTPVTLIAAVLAAVVLVYLVTYALA